MAEPAVPGQLMAIQGGFYLSHYNKLIIIIIIMAPIY